ncbi:MAG: hypothetical protein WAV95_09780 [Azonexus sp.]
MIVLVLGWMAVTAVFSRSAEGSPVQLLSDRHDREIIKHGSAAIVRISAEFSTQIGEIRSEVLRAQNIFSEAVAHLIRSFRDINTYAQRQRQLGMVVHDLSGRTNHFNQQIRTSLDGMQVTIGSAEQTINQMTAPDMTFALTSRRDVEPAMQSSKAGKDHAGDAVGELNRMAVQLEAAVNKAVLSLQFEDVVTQLLGHVGRRLDVLDEVVDDEQRLAEVLRDSGDPEATLRTLDALRAHVEQLAQKLVTLKKGVDNNPVSQTGYASGDVELF